MPWLRAGTVAVTNGSTTVTGTNADFAANARTGDSFVGPDGFSYEVANVASATVISILPAYKGPTASGAAYAIMPVQGYDKMLSDAFNNLNNQFGPKLAALGTTGNYDVLPVTKGGTGGTTQATAQAGLGLGTAATGTITTSTTDYTSGRVVRMGDAGVGAMMSPPWPNTSLNNCSGVPQGRYSTTGSTTDLPPGAAVGTVDFGIRNAGAFEYTMTHLSRAGNVLNMRTAAGGSSSSPGWTSWETLVKGGANSTITSLSGLTTALSIAQGGTGNNTGTASKLSGAGILGTVSQSGGVPTGAVIEKGSNANGEFVRFADGTQICRKVVGPVSLPITSQSGQVFISEWRGWENCAAPFIAVPFSSVQVVSGTQLAWSSYAGAATTTAFSSMYVLHPTSVTTPITIYYLAIGRWF